MSSRTTALFVTCMTFLVGFAGCSDDAVRGTLEPSPYLTAPVARFFPIADGYTTQLTVTYADGGSAVHTYEVGAPQMYNYYTAYPLKVYSKATLIATNYVVVADSALFIFENGGSSAAKVLDLPLYSGRSWDRSDESELTGLNDPSGDDGGSDPDEDNLETGGEDPGTQQAPQLFPSSNGQQTMTVVGKETVYLPDGQAFSGTIRIRNDNASGGKNYYWYAPGIGLVKYVINADPYDMNQGTEVGVLTDFGLNLRK